MFHQLSTHHSISDGKTEIVSSGGDGVAALVAGDVVVIAGTSTSSTSTQSSTANPSSGLGSLTGSAGSRPSGAPAGP